MNSINRIMDSLSIVVMLLLVAVMTASFIHSVVKIVSYEADRIVYAPVDKERLKIYTAAAVENQAVSDFRFYADRVRGDK